MAEEKTTIHVDLSERSYDIEISSNTLSQAAQFAAARCRLTHAVVITDQNVESRYAAGLLDSLSAIGAKVDLAVVEPGEASKSVATAEGLWQQMLTFGADRKTVVVALGGGVIGDLAGFIASTFARGIPLFQIPTTLLAQVDSSVGGKVGINLPNAKNMVGAFWQPLGVLIDIEVLKTLPEREYRAGLAEVVKYGVILDAEFFTYLEKNITAIIERQSDVLAHIVGRCCQLKADVVQQDEREETGLRAVLNYGHTFCHAIEAETGYGQFLHGEAVAIGMLCASRLSESLGRVDAAFTRRQRNLLSAFNLPLEVPQIKPELLLAAMQRDKKVEHGQLRFVLPTKMGYVELVEGIDPSAARDALFA